MWLIGKTSAKFFHKGANHVKKQIKIYKINRIAYVYGTLVWLQQ
jgi:hypothetical protein